MAERELAIKVSATRDGNNIDVTISEMAVLLTAINRALNKAIYADVTNRSWFPPGMGSYDPLGHEPALVEFSISSATTGSVELQTIANFLESIGLDPATAKDLLVGIIASLIADPRRIETLSSDMRRAISRISKSASGKVFRVILKMRDHALTVTAAVSREAEIRVQIGAYPPDDIQ